MEDSYFFETSGECYDYGDYRYVLGVKGENPLMCFGINPSTATLNVSDSKAKLLLDPTLRRVKNFAEKGGYDSWIMFNLYPQRATDPDELDETCNDKQHKENLKVIQGIVKNGSTVVAAWGDNIDGWKNKETKKTGNRSYFFECLQDIAIILKEKQIMWLQIGDLTDDKNPRHPLFAKKEAQLKEFGFGIKKDRKKGTKEEIKTFADIDAYIAEKIK